MIKNIIFDFGGVMIDDRSDDQVLKQLIAELPLELQHEYKQRLIQSELGQIPYEEVLKADKILFPNKTYKQCMDYFFNTKVYEPFYIAEKLLTKYQVIIFSNNHAGAPELVAKFLNIDISKFPFVNSALVGMRKPDTNFYHYLVETFKLQPSESIFIDNTLHNLAPAEQLGFKTFHYKHNTPDLVFYLKQLGIEN